VIAACVNIGRASSRVFEGVKIDRSRVGTKRSRAAGKFGKTSSNGDAKQMAIDASSQHCVDFAIGAGGRKRLCAIEHSGRSDDPTDVNY